MKKSIKLLLLQFGFAITAIAAFTAAMISSPTPIPPRDILLLGMFCVLVYAYLNERELEAIESEFGGVDIS